MKPKNVLLSAKQTAYEYFKRENDNLAEILSAEDLATIKAGHDEHYAALNHVRKVLESLGIPYQRVYQPYAAFEEFKGRDLVISVGGDGTVLNTAHYITDETPVLTVKSDGRSKGALCLFDATEFQRIIEDIVSDNHKTELWTRVEGRLGNKTDLALNDILVGPKYSPGAARYNIRFSDTEEKQISSGVITSTGAGSTGWYVNIAGNNGTFSRTAQELRFIAREYRTDAGYTLTKGTLGPSDVLEIRSLMNIDGIVSFDGDTQKRMHSFARGETIQMRISDKPLHVVVPQNSVS
ncbi:MAG: NAD(+)/NADH kinase [DPANN group archaeon]|nr:NAD(+)/NADH kinase [DPANN group archaeon]